MPYHNEVLDAVIHALDGAITENYIRQNINEKHIQGQKPREALFKKLNKVIKCISLSISIMVM